MLVCASHRVAVCMCLLCLLSHCPAICSMHFRFSMQLVAISDVFSCSTIVLITLASRHEQPC